VRTLFKKKEKDLRELGSLFGQRRNLLPGIVFVYALTPLPTNNLFIAAGMVKTDLRRVLAGFWAARIPADLFWVWTSNVTVSSFKGLLEKGFGPVGIALQCLGIASVLLLYVLPWSKWLSSYLEKHGMVATTDAEAGGTTTAASSTHEGGKNRWRQKSTV